MTNLQGDTTAGTSLRASRANVEKFLLWFAAAVLLFLIAGLLYLLCFKHVDNLGAYSIPSGDRPSHPIWLHQLRDAPLVVPYIQRLC